MLGNKTGAVVAYYAYRQALQRIVATDSIKDRIHAAFLHCGKLVFVDRFSLCKITQVKSQNTSKCFKLVLHTSPAAILSADGCAIESPL